MASAAVESRSYPISESAPANSPSPEALQRQYRISEAARRKLAIDALPPLHVYRSLPDEFISCELDKTTTYVDTRGIENASSRVGL